MTGKPNEKDMKAKYKIYMNCQKDDDYVALRQAV